MCTKFGDPRLRDVNWDIKKHEKNADFWIENLLIRL